MKVLVYGWYHQLNIGDDLFVEAFQKLFPDFQFVFHNNINSRTLEGVDAVFFGGGSFLLSQPVITPAALEELKTKPIFYIGVGVEAEINSVHIELMKIAKLIATRSADQVDKLKNFNPNVMWIPDLVYSLQSSVKAAPKQHHSVLVMPNICVVPHHLDPHWKHASWNHFKSEFAQFLDVISKDGYRIDFLSMCQGNRDNDDWAAGELISHMTRRGKFIITEQPTGIEQVTSLISKYSLVITQRFHGIVLSEMTKTPYIALHHHDKLKYTYPRNGAFLSYYNCSKQLCIDAFDHTIKMKFTNTLPIESNIFETLVEEVRSHL